MSQPSYTLDAYRYTGSFDSKINKKAASKNRLLGIIACKRKYENSSGIIKKIIKKRFYYLCRSSGIDINVDTEIGEGFAIFHGFGIVVNKSATIGRNVTLMHGVTIGQADAIGEDGARSTGCPAIGDNVWIGPNASVVGGVKIGSGARILAGASVYFDVPDRALVAGNPGKIVRENVPEDVINKPPR
jgi:serine O-acetyltransferase